VGGFTASLKGATMLELFDGIEIHRFIVEGGKFIDTTEIENFDVITFSNSKIIYSVQGHLETGGVDDIADFESEQMALEVAGCINAKLNYHHGINIHY